MAFKKGGRFAWYFGINELKVVLCVNLGINVPKEVVYERRF